MTYLQFHLLFNAPALALLIWLTRGRVRTAHVKWIVAICAIVLLVTTPWDNWAVYKGIWSFDWNRVTPIEATVGGVRWRLPAEEYGFFLVETIMVSLLTIPVSAARRARPMKWHYFAHLVGWTAPVLLGQWAIGWRIFRRNLAAVFVPALIGMTFFAVVDSVAVRTGLWFFDPRQICGLHVGPLPVEEVLFFFLTSLLITQSLVLFLPAAYRR